MRLALRTPREPDQRYQPEERIDDGDPIEVVPRAAPGKKRAPTIRALPVQIEVAQDRRTDACRQPSPRRNGDRSTVAAEDPARRTPPRADEERETDDLQGGADERVSNAAMEDQVVGARSWKSDQELAQVGHVRRDDPDQRGAGHVPIGDGAHESGSDEGVSEIVHATRCGKTSRPVQGNRSFDSCRISG